MHQFLHMVKQALVKLIQSLEMMTLKIKGFFQDLKNLFFNKFCKNKEIPIINLK
jgi:hypothetical protein